MRIQEWLCAICGFKRVALMPSFEDAGTEKHNGHR